jgi:predicted TIM-barrel fold metal-dependent hydrolase
MAALSNTQAAGAPLVDSHVHIFKQDMPLIPNPRHAPTYGFTAEQLEETLDAHGVKLCVIAAASPWGDCNDYVVQALRSRPLWRGTAILEPTVGRAELDELARAGMVGVRLPFISLQQLPDLTTGSTGVSSGAWPTWTGTCTCTWTARASRRCCRCWRTRA